jgi:hypothetical protein
MQEIQISTLPAGFEPAITASEGLQINATGIGRSANLSPNKAVPFE